MVVYKFEQQGGEAWSSRNAHNVEFAGSNPAPAPNFCSLRFGLSSGSDVVTANVSLVSVLIA